MFNSQFPMFIRWCRFLSPRMRIEHRELSIGQIYQNVLNSYERAALSAVIDRRYS